MRLVTYYRILRAGAERDGVPDHEHDGTDLSGEAVFLVLRADRIYAGVLEVVDIISEDWNGANPPDLSGGSQDPTATAGYALDSSGGAAQFNGDVFLHQNSVLFVGGSLNATGTLFANAFTQGVDGWRLNPTGSVEFYDPVFVGDHSAASPSVRRLGTADGQFFGSGFVGLAIGGVEVARFTANGLRGIEQETASDVGAQASFTNTVTADLDALTGTPLGSAVAVTVTTGTEALVILTGQLANTTAGSQTIMQYRISGATTLAADDDRAILNANTGRTTCSATILQTGLTAGANTFELQARVTANTGVLERARLTVIPL